MIGPKLSISYFSISSSKKIICGFPILTKNGFPKTRLPKENFMSIKLTSLVKGISLHLNLG